jgi:hypothetical protein
VNHKRNVDIRNNLETFFLMNGRKHTAKIGGSSAENSGFLEAKKNLKV